MRYLNQMICNDSKIPDVLSVGQTVMAAVTVINSSNAHVAFVVDGNKRLIGTVTDGDIRRGLLSGESVHSPVERVMFKQFRWLPKSANEDEALRLMRREGLHQLPILDEHGHVVRVFTLDDLKEVEPLCNTVIVMAGGEGKRLRPLTDTCPKPMLPIGGKPILEIALEQCIDAGFQQFYFSVNYLKKQIMDYFGDGARWQVLIDYLEEKQPLGTGGSLSLLPITPVDPVLVINGDVLTKIDYKRLLAFHAKNQAAATMCVREFSTQIPYGVVTMDGVNVASLEEKPEISHQVNAGIYIIEPALLNLVPHDCSSSMPQLLKKAKEQNFKVCAFPIHEYWLDIGLPETLTRAIEDWR